MKRTAMSEWSRACWYKNAPGGIWRGGTWHAWSIDFEELNHGVGQFPVAIIEDDDTQKIVVFPATFVSFAAEKPS